MAARFDGLITAVETGVAGEGQREEGRRRRGGARRRNREAGLCASVSSADKLVRIVSGRLKWLRGPIRHLKCMCFG